MNIIITGYYNKNNFGDDLFDGRLQGFGKRAFTEPSEGDLFVKFETQPVTGTQEQMYVANACRIYATELHTGPA